LVRIRIRQYHCEEDESRQNRVKNAEFQLHLGKDYFKEFDSELNELMTNQDRTDIERERIKDNMKHTKQNSLNFVESRRKYTL
jgi:hypothetical protein